MFPLERPQRGNSNEYIQYAIFNTKKKITLHYPKFAALGFFSKGLENEYEAAMVNEPSVFKPLKVYCIKMNEYILGEVTLSPHLFSSLLKVGLKVGQQKEVASVGGES